MEFPYSREHDNPTGHLMPPNKILSARTSSILLSQIGPKGYQKTPQTLVGIAKSISYSPQSESKALFLKTLLSLCHQAWRHCAGVQLEANDAGQHYGLYQRRKVIISYPIAANPENHNRDLPIKYTGVIVAQTQE